MLFGFPRARLDDMHRADLAYGRALEEMLLADAQFRAIASEVSAIQLPERVRRLVETALETAETHAPTIQGPLDRSTPAVAFPYPHSNGSL